MGKARTLHRCRECRRSLPQWTGRCPGCEAWGTVEEDAADRRGDAAVVAISGGEAREERLSTGLRGVDRVFGGGLVPGSVVLLAGEPGIGKSTLLLQIAGRLAASGRECLVASGEESLAQVGARAARIGIAPERLAFVPGRELAVVMAAVSASRPSVLIVDSIQALRDAENAGLPGAPSQVRACADALVGVAKEHGTVALLSGQVTKDGDVAGPRTLEHAVDVVCSFEGDARTGLRVLSGGKNRFGAEGEVAWFEMGPEGLTEVEPSRILAPGEGDPGAATALVAAGRRALAVELQALVGGSDGPPRRQVSGLDVRRFGLIAAVLDRALGLPLARAELYGAAAGGLRVDDPGADLALAAALASAATGRPAPPRTAFAAEVGLTGVLRPAPGVAARLAAAAACGIETVFCAGEARPLWGVRPVAVRHLRDALAWARPRAESPG